MSHWPALPESFLSLSSEAAGEPGDTPTHMSPPLLPAAPSLSFPLLTHFPSVSKCLLFSDFPLPHLLPSLSLLHEALDPISRLCTKPAL